MKKTTKFLIIVVALTLNFELLTLNSFAQAVEYTYDAAGNRTQRKLAILDPGGGTGRYMQPKDTVVAAITLDLKLTVYPNPVKEQLNLKVEGNFTAYQVILTDLTGKVFLSKTVNDNFTQLDFTPYPKGTYLLRTGANNQFTEWKIVKQ